MLPCRTLFRGRCEDKGNEMDWCQTDAAPVCRESGRREGSYRQQRLLLLHLSPGLPVFGTGVAQTSRMLQRCTRPHVQSKLKSKSPFTLIWLGRGGHTQW